MTGAGRKGTGRVTLVRAISKFGAASRRRAEALVIEGKVSVNGKIIRKPDLWVDPRADVVNVEGERLRKRKAIYLVMHKPAGIVTTRADERGRRTVYDLLPPGTAWVFPIGRLDKETSGLLLLTNDTQFGERVTNPLRKIGKTYRLELDRPLSAEARRLMAQGMVLSDGTRLKPAVVRQDENDPNIVEVTLFEGKNRQIRRMCDELGHEVRALKRTSIGPIALGSLAEGATRSLTEDEQAFIINPPGRRRT